MDTEQAVQSGMPLLEWTYPDPPREYRRLVHEKTGFRGLTPVVVGAAGIASVGTVAVLNPWLALAAAPVGVAIYAALFAADRAGLFERPINVSELPPFPPEVLFTSTGMVFGAHAYLWGPLHRADFVTTDWSRIELEFRNRWGHSTLVQVPVPEQLASHTHELSDWLNAKIEGRAEPPWRARK